jgi:vacuolar-type H+-ATPase subunit D/Vma8
MDRLHELERMRRSIAMLEPGTKALSREEAMRLIAELQDLERRMRSLREALTGVLAEGPLQLRDRRT